MKKLVAGILAHVDSGKTTLSEALLYTTGSISTLGRVDHRDSFLDTFSLERERGITIFSKQAVMSLGDTELTLLDTPGHVDFSAETERTLQVLDYAILVISGTDGVQSHTKTLFNLLHRYSVPVFIFVNKMDLDGADREVVLNDLHKKLSDGCVDFTDINDELYESVALCDDALLSEFYDSGKIKNSSIVTAVKKRKVFPVMFGSALKNEGVSEFLNCFDAFTEMPEYPDNFGAKVFKISEDTQGKRLTHIKVTGGTLRVRDVLESKKNTNAEKVSQIRIYSGDKFKAVDEAAAGTVCAVLGVNFTASGDGLGCEPDSALPVLEPVLTYRLELPEGVDAHTALSKMRLLESEDPQLKVVYNERLGEIQVQLMGDIQLEVLQSVIKERFGFVVTFGKGNIIYKETIKNTVEGVGHFEPLRHYAEVHLLLKPLPRNSGLVFKSDCSVDTLDKNWQRLILTHLYEKTHIGVLTGSPITDMEITLASGRAHSKHTEGGDFRQATYRAVRQGLKCAESVLLEPYYAFTLEVPNECFGRAVSDIQLMCGEFDAPNQNEEFTTITGTAPVSTMSDYTKEVMQYTRGRGRLYLEMKGYEVCHNQNEVIESIGYDADGDTFNPCDSVFCSHGAGYVVKWDEVPSHMHLLSALSKPKSEYVPTREKFKSVKNTDNIFALDKELMQIFEQTYGPVKQRSFEPQVSTVKAEKKPNPRKVNKPKYDGTEYLLVDGYNLIYSWDYLKKLADDSIDGARVALVNILCNYTGYKKCETILVFDAYKVKGNTREIEKIDNITVVYTKEAETADMYIEKTSHKLAKNNKVRVVTSDALEQLIILGSGALRVSSREFQHEVKQAEEEIRELLTLNG